MGSKHLYICRVVACMHIYICIYLLAELWHELYGYTVSSDRVAACMHIYPLAELGLTCIYPLTDLWLVVINILACAVWTVYPLTDRHMSAYIHWQSCGLYAYIHWHSFDFYTYIHTVQYIHWLNCNLYIFIAELWLVYVDGRVVAGIYSWQSF
jgi:hypothetical protein